MDLNKLTPWFDGMIAPFREGVYQRIYNSSIYYSSYRNGVWGVICMSPNATTYFKAVSEHQYLPWRGLNGKSNNHNG
jgi:hypothetical protein